MRLAAMAIVLALAGLGGEAAAQTVPLVDCADPAAAAAGEQAFATFCVNCHEAGTMAARQFRDPTTQADDETALAAFLDRHSGCPHDRHEAIAAYLRSLAFPR